MTFRESVSTCFRKFSDFNGRARRSEYWWFYLFLQLVSLVILGVPYAVLMLGVLAQIGAESSGSDAEPVIGGLVGGLVLFAIGFVLSLVLAVPGLAAAARRLHDTGQSAHWLWLNVAGLGIVPTVMCVMEGQPHDNQWGPDPKAAERVWQPVPVSGAAGYGVPGGGAAGYGAPAYGAPASPPPLAPPGYPAPPVAPPAPPLAPPVAQPPADPFGAPQ